MANILYIDDDKTSLAIIRSLLSRRGHSVQTTENGHDGLRCIEENRPDLLLLDLEMPDFNGWEILQKIRATYNSFQLPVLILTGRDEGDEVLRAINLGANDFLSKPISAAVLRVRVETALALRRMNKDRDVLAHLSARLAASDTLTELVDIVEEESAVLFNWDAQFLAMIPHYEEYFDILRHVDTVDGEKKHFQRQRRLRQSATPLMREVLSGQSRLIQKSGQEANFVGNPFGDNCRPSASLMYVPIVKGEKAIGVISVQSYTPGAYGSVEMDSLHEFADAVAPALDRIFLQERLRDRERQYREVVEGSADVILQCSPTGYITFINQSALPIFGHHSSACIDRSIDTFLHPADVEGIWCTIRNAVEEKTRVIQFEALALRADGTAIYTSWNATLDISSTGELKSIDVIIRDIDARKKVELKLNENLRRFQTLFDLSPSGIIVEDADGTILEANGAVCESLGLSQSDLVGRNIASLNPKESQEVFTENIARLLAGEVLVHEVKNVRSDGTVRHMALHEKAISLPCGRQGIFVTSLDITGQKAAEQDRDRYFNLSIDMMCIAGFDGLLRNVNKAFSATLGYSEEELLGKRVLRYIHPDDRKATVAELRKAREGINTVRFEHRVRCKDGSYKWLTWNSHPDQELRRIYAIARDVTEEKANRQALVKLARIDGLTGLLNRRAFLERCTEEIDRSTRDGSPLCMLILDIDHFKQVNDQYGHPMGDEVIVRIAAVLGQQTRSYDLVGRYGGEEYCVCLPNTGEAIAMAVAERLRVAIGRETFEAAGVEFSVTVSIGIGLMAPTGEPIASLLKRADEALYEAKRGGRNRVCQSDLVCESGENGEAPATV